MFKKLPRAGVLLALASLFTTCVFAADAPYPRSADVSSINGLMLAYYDVVSGPAKMARDVARDKSLHHPDARVYYPGRDTEGHARVTSMTIEEYHRHSASALEQGFYEVETERSVRQFGPSIQVWSTYESRATPQGPVTGRGINNLILLFDGKRYSILAETWSAEDKDHPLPTTQAKPR
ncbi:MAG: nuclear transport factor 2 family protein [Pseudomonadota bacterium]|nr:nuclear transport factor 2 family protein [Pseudomonadota bacterium]